MFFLQNCSELVLNLLWVLLYLYFKGDLRFWKSLLLQETGELVIEERPLVSYINFRIGNAMISLIFYRINEFQLLLSFLSIDTFVEEYYFWVIRMLASPLNEASKNTTFCEFITEGANFGHTKIGEELLNFKQISKVGESILEAGGV